MLKSWTLVNRPSSDGRGPPMAVLWKRILDKLRSSPMLGGIEPATFEFAIQMTSVLDEKA
jgi:hypothetical protein